MGLDVLVEAKGRGHLFFYLKRFRSGQFLSLHLAIRRWIISYPALLRKKNVDGGLSCQSKLSRSIKFFPFLFFQISKEIGSH